MIKRLILSIAIAVFALAGFNGSAFAATPNFNVSGNYHIAFNLTGDTTQYVHDATLNQTAGGNVTGSGGYPAGGPYQYTWNVTSGNVSGNTITLTVSYTVGAPGTVMHMTGTILPNGMMSGTWDDNYGGARTGQWQTTQGTAQVLVHKYTTSNLSFYGPTDATGGFTCSAGRTPTGATFGWVKMWTPLDGNVHGMVVLMGAQPNTTYQLWVNQDPGGCPLGSPNGGTLTTDQYGFGLAQFSVPIVSGAYNYWVSAVGGSQVLRTPSAQLY